MTHFHISHLSEKDQQGLRMIVTPCPMMGFKAHFVPEDGGCLVLMPTVSPVVKPGIPIVEIGDKYPILVPHRDGKPGHYTDVRYSAIRRDGYTWWVSRHTEDPLHVLLAWNGTDVPDPSRRTNHNLLDVGRS